MTALYTWDVFSTLDGYGSFAEGADWGGYWGKQGPELLEHRAGRRREDGPGTDTIFVRPAELSAARIAWSSGTVREPLISRESAV